MSPGPPTDQERHAFGHALAAAITASPLGIGALAEQLGITDDAIRKYARGTVPPPRTIFVLERLLGLPAGDLSQHLGYRPVNAGASVIDAIGADPNLDDAARRILRAVYLEVRQR